MTFEIRCETCDALLGTGSVPIHGTYCPEHVPVDPLDAILENAIANWNQLTNLQKFELVKTIIQKIRGH